MDDIDPNTLTPADNSGTVPGNVDQYLQRQQLIKQLGGSSANQEKLAALKSQQAMAEYLRNGPSMPHGTYIPGKLGGVYVGANALQDANAAGGYAAGAALQGKLAGREMDMAGDEANNRTAVMNQLNSQNLTPTMMPDSAFTGDIAGAAQEPDYNMLMGTGGGGGSSQQGSSPISAASRASAGGPPGSGAGPAPLGSGSTGATGAGRQLTPAEWAQILGSQQ